MSKKKLEVGQLTNELERSAFFQKPAQQPEQSPTQKVTPTVEEKDTQVSTQTITHVRDNSREIPRELPTGDEIEEFSFQLRKSYKVKIQAELPPEWQEELQEIARQRKVGKLELYRFIFGEFLGKVKRKK